MIVSIGKKNSHAFECITGVTCIIKMEIKRMLIFIKRMETPTIMFIRMLASVNMQWLIFTRLLVY